MATKYYYGDAEDIADVWTLTPANVGIGNTFTITIGGKDITVTATAATVANVTALLAAAINDNVNEIEEFAEVEAVDNTTHVTVTALEKGVPIGLSASASGGTATHTPSNTTVATGSKFFDNADNYAGDVAPVNEDTVVHVRGDILYGLSQSSLDVAEIIKLKGSGLIGLPEFHQSGASGYKEYRTTALTLQSLNTLTIEDDASLCKINVGTLEACVAVIRSEGIRQGDEPVVQLTGGNASNALHIQRGDVGVAFHEADTANWPTINVGFVSNIQGDSQVFLGNGLSTVTTYQQTGGRVTSEAPMTTMTLKDGTFRRLAGAIATALIDGGSYEDQSAANISSLIRVSDGGIANFNFDLRSLTINDVYLYAGAIWLDRNRRATYTNGIDLVRCALDDVTLDIGDHVNLVLSGAA